LKEADGAEQLDDFTFGVEAAQFGELGVGDGVRVAGDGLGKAQGGFFGGSEIVAPGPIGEMGELVVGPAEVFGEEGVAGQAIGGHIDLAGADNDQLLQFC